MVILKTMDELDHSDINCIGCSAKCCTFRHNSMQITPVETKDLYEYLVSAGRWNEELIQTLKDVIRDNRLDSIGGHGRRELRKTYTCPFFSHGPLGCSIPPEVKPYGCLAFNPTKYSSDEDRGCTSDTTLLESRESLANSEVESEDQTNRDLKDKFGLWWDKLPIPMALIEFNNRIR